MTIANDEKALREMQRLTKLARATDDCVLRADYYRLAQQSREQVRPLSDLGIIV
jgi:hypothetical protein